MSLDLTGLPCAEQTRSLGGSIAGTAVDGMHTWLMVEVRAPWGPKGLPDTELPEGLARKLKALSAKGNGVRVQLIRRPQTPADAPVTVLLARVRPGSEAVRALELPNLDALLDVELASWCAAPESLGVAVDGPLYLVCTHGRRDRCCALFGVSVYTALTEVAPEATWQTSHLGGHRFAATLLALPEGICFGQVEATEAGALHEAWGRGEAYDAQRVRGRVAWSREAQAAEVLRGSVARRAPTLGGLDHLDDGGVSVTLDADRVVIREQVLGAVESSCGAGEAKEARAWTLEALNP